MYCKCKPNTIIPPARVALGYKTCVECSTVEKHSYIPIIANKQIQELQIVSPSLSALVHKSWRRK